MEQSSTPYRYRSGDYWGTQEPKKAQKPAEYDAYLHRAQEEYVRALKQLKEDIGCKGCGE